MRATANTTRSEALPAMNDRQPDHRVPPDVPLENYIHFCRTGCAVWGRHVILQPAKTDNP